MNRRLAQLIYEAGYEDGQERNKKKSMLRRLAIAGGIAAGVAGIGFGAHKLAQHMGSGIRRVRQGHRYHPVDFSKIFKPELIDPKPKPRKVRRYDFKNKKVKSKLRPSPGIKTKTAKGFKVRTSNNGNIHIPHHLS